MGKLGWFGMMVCTLLSVAISVAEEVKPPAPKSEKKEDPVVDVMVTGKKNPKKVAEEPAPEPAALTSPTIEEARQQIARTPGGASVVDAEETKKGRASNMADVFKYTPGVIAVSRFGAEEARLSIRGSGIQRTFHGRGIKLMQDGVPLNLADGGFDMQAVEPLATKYVEVHRGANALQHGATTLGGSVNFITPTGYDASKVQARQEYGSYGYLRSQISSGQVIGPADYYLSLTRVSQDGYRNHSEQENYRVVANTGWRINPDLETRFYFNYVDTTSELPGSLTRREFHADSTQADRSGTGSLRFDNHRDFNYVRVANRTTYRWGKERAEFGLGWSYKDLDHPITPFAGVIDQVSNDFVLNFRYTNENDVAGHRNILTLGASPTYGRVEEGRFHNRFGHRGPQQLRHPDFPFITISNQDTTQRSANLDFFGEDQFYVLDKLALVGGIQISRAYRDLEDNFPVTLPADQDNSDDFAWWGISPKLGLRYEWTKRSQAYFNASRSFEPPTFGELVSRGGFAGLVDLNPQRATTIEVGTRGEEGRFAWDFSFYHAWVDGELLTTTDPLRPGVTLTLNAKDTTHTGVELGFDVELFSGIAAKGKGGNKYGADRDRIVLRQVYTWGRFRFDDDNRFGNNQIAGLPEHLYRAELNYEHPVGFYAGPNLEWVPEAYAIDHANNMYSDGYALVGFKAGYKTKRGFSAFVEGRNLADHAYVATPGVSDVITNNNTARVLAPGDGRAFYIGLEWKW